MGPRMAFKSKKAGVGEISIRSYSYLFMSLAWIPKGILEKMRICFKFLWEGSKDQYVFPWVNWVEMAAPKILGGWGLKNIFLFSKALAAKSSWKLITKDNLWTKVVSQKYIHPELIKEWIRSLAKERENCTIIWKALLKSFPVIGERLAWKVGRGNKVRVGTGPWPGSGNNHILPEELVRHLNTNGIFYIYQIADPSRTTIWSQE